MKILMVSIPTLHFFSWTEQLKNAGHEVHWFDISDSRKKVEKINWVHQIIGWKLKFNYPGHDFIKGRFPFLFKILQKLNENKIQKIFEQKLIEIQPDIVHSFAMQLSCVPILDVMKKYPSVKWVYSSWGSDMFYTKEIGINEIRMEEALTRINYLITDCFRDFEIAQKKGFENIFLGVFPGNGGITYDDKLIFPILERKTILIKGYNDTIGKGINIIKALSDELISMLNDFTVVVFGADEEIHKYIEENTRFEKLKIEVHSRNKFISNKELVGLMGSSYIYVGNSISDGIPNSLIEAAGMGAFPIQSNPGNVTTEIINDKENGLLIFNPLDIQEIQELIKKALQNQDMIDKAFQYNTTVLKNKYDRDKNKQQIIKLYDSIS